jgi:hypothetical protein
LQASIFLRDAQFGPSPLLVEPDMTKLRKKVVDQNVECAGR